MQATLAFEARSTLGEGSLWNHKTQELYWVDIEEGILHILNPKSNSEQTIPVGQRIGTVVPAENGNVIVALQNGLYELDLKAKEKKLLFKPLFDSLTMRFNDGKCDRAGRLWVGSMHLDLTSKVGSLFRVDQNRMDPILNGITISNGICWSGDNSIMYYIDTPTHEIKAYDFDLSMGSVSNGRVIIEMKNELANPDGMTIDSDGMLWVAHWGGGCVTQWNPITATLLAKVQVPAVNVTSCAFGGDNLDILYITTASEEMTEVQHRTFPLAGSVFQVVPGTRGVACSFFKPYSGLFRLTTDH